MSASPVAEVPKKKKPAQNSKANQKAKPATEKKTIQKKEPGTRKPPFKTLKVKNTSDDKLTIEFDDGRCLLMSGRRLTKIFEDIQEHYTACKNKPKNEMSPEDDFYISRVKGKSIKVDGPLLNQVTSYFEAHDQ